MNPNEAAKNTALAGIAGIGVLGLSGWLAVIYAAYQYGKGNKGKALTAAGAGVVAFLSARAVAKATVKNTKAALAVRPVFNQPKPAQQPQQVQNSSDSSDLPPMFNDDVASVYDVE